jgi:hypothetical protein
MEWSMFGWREVFFLFLAVAVTYLLVLLLKLTQIGRGKKITPIQEPDLDRSAAAATTAEPHVADAVTTAQPSPNPEWGDVQALFGGEETASEQSIAAQPSGFGEHLAEHLARSEMEMEMQRMRTELEHLRTELEELRVTRRVSPHYAEAMELAQRGLSAQSVADQLDISLAEAELVQALSRGDKNFKEGGKHGADVYAADDRNTEFDNSRDG